MLRRERLTEDGAKALARELNRHERRLAAQVAGDPAHLLRFERSVRSQNGEDGIVLEILRRIAPTDYSFLEIGASDGKENCTAALLESGWRGAWIEGDPAKALLAQERTDGLPVKVAQAFVDRDNIVAVTDQLAVADRVDLLVIDIDGNDYWVWKQLAARVAARVVVIEYNAVAGPSVRWIMPYDPRHIWQETARHGASLAALADLGRQLGYSLIGCDSRGVNAFFVAQADSAPFTIRSIAETYVPPRHRLPWGHRQHPHQIWVSAPLGEDDAARIDIAAGPLQVGSVSAGGGLFFWVSVQNMSPSTIGSPTEPLTLPATWWIDADGHRLPGEPVRSHQDWRAARGETANLVCRAVAPDTPGEWTLMVGLVQEGVRWLTSEAVVGTVNVKAG